MRFPLFKRLVTIGMVITTFTYIATYFVNWEEQHWLINFLEVVYAPDGVITCFACIGHRIRRILFSILLVSAFLFVFDPTREVTKISSRIFKTNAKLFYAASILLILLFHLALFVPFGDLYQEDHFFENLTAILFLSSSLILIIKLIRLPRLKSPGLGLLIAILFFLGMEEISWGQRLFSWQTPELWLDVNRQNETNLHNLLSHGSLAVVYATGNFFLAFLLLKADAVKRLLSRFSWSGSFVALFPSPQLRNFGFIFLFLSIHATLISGELTEEIFSVFGLTYAWDFGRETDAVAP